MSELNTKAERVAWVMDELESLYPETPVPLDHTDPYTLLVAVLLSAQCTDARVNTVTPDPFAPAAHELLQAVKDAGVSDDKLLDAALKAADKIADKLERKDLSSWEEAY